MAANTEPRYLLAPRIIWPDPITTANTSRDGTSGIMSLVWQGHATESTRLERIVATARGANAATVWRVWVNNGGVTTVAANNCLLPEKSLPLTAASEINALPPFEYYLGLVIPPAYRVYTAIGTAGTAGWQMVGMGGDF